MSLRTPYACFGWSARAWAQPWGEFLRAHPDLRVADALEVGASAHSSLAPLLLDLAQRVECSTYDAATLPAVQALHSRLLNAEQQARVHYTQQDVRALQGRWNLIVLKSVLGGVYRVHGSSLDDVRTTLSDIVHNYLEPGGLLVTLDNGRTVLEPLLAGLGARRNGWRFFRRGDLPPAQAHYSYGVLSVASAATRWGRLGVRIDDALYWCDRVLTPLAHQHAVHLNVYRRPS
ncbi:MAG: hypothetical protein LBQ20_00425 [Rhodanobacter sp.]|jgi:hypothetical protein|nr:hypothetical protein [Rhodanobacter sp.]